MRRFLLLFTVSLVTLCATAQPRQTIVEVLVAPDDSDWQYKCGEEVRFNLSVLKSGHPLENAQIRYEISEDMMEPLKQGELTLKNGTTQIKAGTLKKPGFLRLRVWATHGDLTFYGLATAGFDIHKIEPTTTLPAI